MAIGPEAGFRWAVCFPRSRSSVWTTAHADASGSCAPWHWGFQLGSFRHRHCTKGGFGGEELEAKARQCSRRIFPHMFATFGTKSYAWQFTANQRRLSFSLHKFAVMENAAAEPTLCLSRRSNWLRTAHLSVWRDTKTSNRRKKLNLANRSNVAKRCKFSRLHPTWWHASV